MIKNILFDFDGVILDSMKIKGDGFLFLFDQYGSKYTKQIEAYHYKNGGVSRFKKIEYFFKEILQKEISEEEIIKLSNQFAEIISKSLFNKDNLILDSVDFIRKNHKNYNLHIVSGAEHSELNSLCNAFNLTDYFLSIEGSPTPKGKLVSGILNRYNYVKSETILIGDSINDFHAADENKIAFFAYNNEELKEFNYIESFMKFNV